MRVEAVNESTRGKRSRRTHLIHQTAAHALHIIDIECWIREGEASGSDENVQGERWWAGGGLRSTVRYYEESRVERRRVNRDLGCQKGGASSRSPSKVAPADDLELLLQQEVIAFLEVPAHVPVQF